MMGAAPSPLQSRGLVPRPTYRGFRGEHLRALRERLGLTQEQLAVRLRVYPSMVGKWERGQVVPAPTRMAALAAALHVRPQEFTGLPAAQGSLVDLRLWAGLTRAQAAAAAGISTDRLRRLEHLTVEPGTEEADRLAGVYGVSPDAVRLAWARELEQLDAGLSGVNGG